MQDSKKVIIDGKEYTAKILPPAPCKGYGLNANEEMQRLYALYQPMMNKQGLHFRRRG